LAADPNAISLFLRFRLTSSVLSCISSFLLLIIIITTITVFPSPPFQSRLLQVSERRRGANRRKSGERVQDPDRERETLPSSRIPGCHLSTPIRPVPAASHTSCERWSPSCTSPRAGLRTRAIQPGAPLVMRGHFPLSQVPVRRTSRGRQPGILPSRTCDQALPRHHDPQSTMK
jgi:hypothetical protein